VLPQQYAALIREAEACLKSGRNDEAERALVEVLRLNPREHFAWSLLASLALQRSDPELALAHIQRALELDRRNAGYLNLHGVALAEAGQLDAAEAALRRALRQQPANAEAHYNLGKVLQKKGDLAGARTAYGRAVSLEPKYPGARDNYAFVLQGLGDLQGAISVLEAAVADEPGEPFHWMLLASALMAARGHEATIALYEEACRQLPDSSKLHWYLGHALLAVGDFGRGWRERTLGREALSSRVLPGMPPKCPDRLDARRVLVVSDEGLGDILFYLRFVPLLLERGARVSVRVPDKLVALLQTAGRFESVLAKSASDAGADAAELRILTGDLPFVLDCEKAPAPFALTPRTDLAEGWRARLAPLGPPPYIGVTWRAGTEPSRGPEFGRGTPVFFKAIELDVLGGALRRAPGTLVSLQRLPTPGETDALAESAGRWVHDLSAVNDDLESAAALLAVLDDYVAVSNTNVHLRSGVGRTSRVLMQFPPEWRWMASGESSPWFPGCRIYRQSPTGDWTSAIEALAADLSGAAPPHLEG
jgi:tetratricopeptide (TPR) repeat protein